ncbi:hypothetical protein [Amycolatopsis sp. NPDC059021]|uniref:hypothetical protein n=1 Tax=Amycolatopsis sp. NPDC059021 TaxID=3346704 RepID=UPI00366B8BEF
MITTFAEQATNPGSVNESHVFHQLRRHPWEEWYFLREFSVLGVVYLRWWPEHLDVAISHPHGLVHASRAPADDDLADPFATDLAYWHTSGPPATAIGALLTLPSPNRTPHRDPYPTTACRIPDDWRTATRTLITPEDRSWS